MTSSAIVRGGGPGTAIGRRFAAHPEWGFVLVVVAAWATLVAGALSALLGPGPTDTGMRDAFLCLVGGSGPVASTTAPSVVAGGLGRVAGTVAMMGMLATPALHHVGVTSLRPRRVRLQTLVAGAFLGVWVGLVLVADPALAVARGAIGRETLIVVALAVALAWQHGTPKAAALRSCRRVVPLPPRGRRADIGAFTLGVTTARTCVLTCGPFMLITLAVESGMVAMALFTVIPLIERARPRPDPRLGSAALMGVALIGLVGTRLT